MKSFIDPSSRSKPQCAPTHRRGTHSPNYGSLTFHREVLDFHISDDKGHLAAVPHNARVSKQYEVNPAGLRFYRLLTEGTYLGRHRHRQLHSGCLIDEGGLIIDAKKRNCLLGIYDAIAEIDHVFGRGQPQARNLDAPLFP